MQVYVHVYEAPHTLVYVHGSYMILIGVHEMHMVECTPIKVM